MYRRLCGPQVQSGQVRIILPTPGLDRRTVQIVASRYTDYVSPAGRPQPVYCKGVHHSLPFRCWEIFQLKNKITYVGPQL